MIKVIAAVIITVLCLMFLRISKKIHGRDVFAPLSFFALYFFITRVPRLIRANEVLYGFQDKITNKMIAEYLIITTFFLLAVLMGGIAKSSGTIPILKIGNGVKKKAEYYIKEVNINYTGLFRAGIICFLIGAFSRVFLILRAGGLRVIWSSLYNRTNMLAGAGYIDYLTVCMTFGLSAIEIYVLNLKKHKPLFIILCGIAVILNIAFGNRSPLMKMVLALFFVYWYTSPKRINWKRIINLRNVLLAIVLVTLLIVLPQFRSASFQLNSTMTEDIVKKSFQNMSSIFDQISFYDEDVYSFYYFSKGHFWNGRSYTSLFTAWIPRSLYPGKPPIDEGMYLRAIMKGYDIVPPMSVSALNDLTVSSSVPFTTCGIMYANFGMFGVIIGGLLTGIIIVGQYKKMKKTNSLADILIYQIICTRLAFTNKGIVELLISLVIIKCICGFVYKTQGVNRPNVLFMETEWEETGTL